MLPIGTGMTAPFATLVSSPQRWREGDTARAIRDEEAEAIHQRWPGHLWVGFA
jgi:hypothetical protein